MTRRRFRSGSAGAASGIRSRKPPGARVPAGCRAGLRKCYDMTGRTQGLAAPRRAGRDPLWAVSSLFESGPSRFLEIELPQPGYICGLPLGVGPHSGRGGVGKGGRRPATVQSQVRTGARRRVRAERGVGQGGSGVREL